MRKLLILLGSHIIVLENIDVAQSRAPLGITLSYYTFTCTHVLLLFSSNSTTIPSYHPLKYNVRRIRESKVGNGVAVVVVIRESLGGCRRLWYILVIFFDHRVPRRFIRSTVSRHALLLLPNHLIASYYHHPFYPKNEKGKKYESLLPIFLRSYTYTPSLYFSFFKSLSFSQLSDRLYIILMLC